MNVKLDEIIDKIKTEGVDKGKQEAATLISQAENEAKRIVEEARLQAKNIVEEAKEQSDSIIARGTSALQQAERDLLLVVKQKLADTISKLAQQHVVGTISPEATVEFIKTALSKWNLNSNEALFIHVSKEEAQKINASALASVGTIEIKVDEQLSKGFRISHDAQGTLSYDFSEGAIKKALANFLTQNIQELLQ